ncbi:MAG: histidine--tRNA ligase [Sedimentisphaerales bacterium]
MKIPPVKGTRDFYPQDMAVRNWIIDGWKRVSLRNGFEEYDGPIFEYLKMFQIKSGDEIAEQLFSLKDRGDRELALRPEITPTLARMVNQRINSLPRPIKWFSVPRLFRAERPQKGRLREFFQWNVDIVGEDSVLADAEVIFCALDYLQDVGLTPDDIVVKLSSRKLLAAVLKKFGIAEERLDSLYLVLDKKSKLPPATFEQMLAEEVSDRETAAKIQAFMKTKEVSGIKKVAGPDDEVEKAIVELQELIGYLERMGVGKYCEFDPAIVRGLAYYTGIVYEIYDRASELRAIGGGGRYDDLLKQFGGPAVPATGFGIGDCVLGILLEEKELLKPKKAELDYFVAVADKTFEEQVYSITAKLRLKGCSANFSYKPSGLSKQLKEASEQNAKKCIIIGEEFKAGNIVVKDMSTGKQETIPVKDFIENPKKF